MPPSRKTLTLSLPEPKKIAIVGCYPETWEKAPFDDLSWEIWGFSRRNMGKLPRCDRWFELHDPILYAKYEDAVPGYIDYLKEPFVTTIEKFPKQELETRFGSFFFGSGQLPWLFAYAISLNPEAIGVWGVEALDRYEPQRYDVQHFAQVCHDRGIEIVIPEGCTLLTARKSYI